MKKTIQFIGAIGLVIAAVGCGSSSSSPDTPTPPSKGNTVPVSKGARPSTGQNAISTQ